MTYTTNLTSSSTEIYVGDRLTLTLTVTWKDTDNELTQASVFKLTSASGNVAKFEVTDPHQELPASLNRTKLDVPNRTATYTISLVMTGPGLLKVTAQNDELGPDTSATYTHNILPNDIVIQSTGFDKILLPVFSDNSLTPATAKSDQIAKVRLQASSKQGPNAIGGIPIQCIVENSNSNPNSRVGKFYNNTGGELTPIDSAGLIMYKILTDDNGLAILDVVANQNSGFIDISIKGGDQGIPSTHLYLYDSSVDRSLYSPQVLLPQDVNGNYDITNYDSDVFTVNIFNTTMQPNENLALILNGKLQNQYIKQSFKNNRLEASAYTKDLNTGTGAGAAGSNKLFYTISNLGELDNSVPLPFNVLLNDGNQHNLPTSPIVGPLTYPTGNTINNSSFRSPFIIKVPLSDDNLIITNRGLPAIKTPNAIRVHINVSGDDENGHYRQDQKVADFAIDDYTATEQKITLDEAFFKVYGTPSTSPQNTARYTIWYAYIDAVNSQNTELAQSFVQSGVLNTRAI